MHDRHAPVNFVHRSEEYGGFLGQIFCVIVKEIPTYSMYILRFLNAMKVSSVERNLNQFPFILVKKQDYTIFYKSYELSANFRFLIFSYQNICFVVPNQAQKGPLV